jgi:hypothetical protein
MPNYTVRVELQGSPTREEYDRLHAAMQSLGLYQAVNGQRNGAACVVTLPTGLYYGASSSAAQALANSVNNGATKIRPVVAIFVAETSTWSSLP